MRHEKRKQKERGPPSEPDPSAELGPIEARTPTLDAFRSGQVNIPRPRIRRNRFSGAWVEHTMNWKLAKHEREKAQKERRAHRQKKRYHGESES